MGLLLDSIKLINKQTTISDLTLEHTFTKLELSSNIHGSAAGSQIQSLVHANKKH
ncbi:hypothetical protein [Paenibacillus alba]|uniref:Uncharacterized protein n=1 Tax=Paenibacillus alba TaxID=1197127 RepID=A0ABU6GBM1_9BACL|nr:hypothetical protein [Paenibacillus alba]MEC0231331.1 hypothetical protein [Paenibacillus alba]